MSKAFGKLISKLVFIAAVVMFIVMFKNQIVTDSGFSDTLEQLLDELPFAKHTASLICKLTQQFNQQNIPQFTQKDFFSELYKLTVMAIIQPIFVAVMSLLFLRVPDGTIDSRESFMDGWSYRLKKVIITVISAPLLALATARITALISNYFSTHFSSIVASLLSVASVIGLSLLSLPVLLIFGVALGVALLWRLGVTLAGEMVIVLGTDAFCIWLYFAIRFGLRAQTVTAIILFVIFIIAMETILDVLKYLLASLNLRSR